MTQVPRLALRGLGKRFGQTWVLRGVSLDAYPGRVHAVVGLNGSGKSTLMRAVYGAHQPDEGEILLDGISRRFRGPRDALARGVAAVPQELPVVADLSVTENIFLGMLPASGGVVRRARAREEAARVMAHLHADVDVDVPVGSLDLAGQQLATIARALVRQAGVIVFDEPTSALPARSAQRLHEVIATLRADGEAVLFISQRLHEVLEIADEVTVLRDGQAVAQGAVGDFTADSLLQSMLHGRDTSRRGDRAPGGPPAGQAGDTTDTADTAAAPASGQRHGAVLSVRNLTAGSAVRGVSLDVAAGELVGLLGLPGSGASEILRALFGAGQQERGTVLLDGKPLPGGVRARIAGGLAYVTGDREASLVAGLSVAANMALPGARRLGGLLRRGSERRAAQAQVAALRVEPPDATVPVATLSGGNQQKVLLARWLLGSPRVWLLDDPTRGVDARAQADIHQIISDRVRAGACGLIYSSDLRELLQVASRCLLVADGQVVRELDTRLLTADEVGGILEGSEPVQGTPAPGGQPLSGTAGTAGDATAAHGAGQRGAGQHRAAQ